MLPSLLRMKRIVQPLFVLAALLACTASAQAANLTGTAGNDTLQGGAYSDRLTALGGQDFADGAGGSDVIDAGTGDDIVSQGLGTSTDYIECGAGYDVAYYDSWNPVPLRNCELIVDLRWASGGAITMPRKPLAGTTASDWLTAPWATQSIVVGAEGADKLWGSKMGDFLIGGAGNDFIGTSANTTTTPDRVFAGDGDDAITANSAKSVVDCGNGADTVYATAANVVLRANCEKRIDAGSTGTMGRDTLTTAGTGTLPVFGFGSSDILISTTGADWSYGGGGDDVMIVRSGTAFATNFDCGSGEDLVTNFTRASFGSKDCEYGVDPFDATLRHMAPCFNSAGRITNVVRGTDDADTLQGSMGSCTLENSAFTVGSVVMAGDGNDTVTGGSAGDFIIGGAGNDTLNSGGRTIGTATVIEYIFGGTGDDRITVTGTTQPQVNCGDGNDTLVIPAANQITAVAIVNSHCERVVRT